MEREICERGGIVKRRDELEVGERDFGYLSSPPPRVPTSYATVCHRVWYMMNSSLASFPLSESLRHRGNVIRRVMDASILNFVQSIAFTCCFYTGGELTTVPSLSTVQYRTDY